MKSFFFILTFSILFSTGFSMGAFYEQSAIVALQNAVQTQAVEPPTGYLCSPWPHCKFFVVQDMKYGYVYLGSEYPNLCPSQSLQLMQAYDIWNNLIARKCYVYDPRNTASFYTGTMPASNVIGWLNAHGAPSKFIQSAQLVVFTPSLEFISISASINPGSGTAHETIGVFNNVNGIVTIAYVDANAVVGLLPPPFNAPPFHAGLTPTEVAGIIQTMRALLFQSMYKLVGAYLLRPLNKSLNIKLGNKLTSALTGSLGSWWNQVPNFIHAFDSSTWTKMTEVKQLGFINLREKTNAMKLSGVPFGHEQNIVNDAIQMGILPNNGGLVNLLTNMAPWMGKSYTWTMTSVTWSDNGKMVNSVVFLGIDEEKQREDWFFMTTKCSFVLAPDTIIVQSGSSYLGGLWSTSTTTYEYTPHVLTPSDIVCISLLFEITTASVLSDMFGVKYAFPTLPN